MSNLITNLYSLKHHGELLKRILTHTRLVPSLDLLLKVMLHPHTQLVKLIPRLGQPYSTVLSVPVVQDKVLFEYRSEVFDFFQV